MSPKGLIDTIKKERGKWGKGTRLNTLPGKSESGLCKWLSMRGIPETW